MLKFIYEQMVKNKELTIKIPQWLKIVVYMCSPKQQRPKSDSFTPKRDNKHWSLV